MTFSRKVSDMCSVASEEWASGILLKQVCRESIRRMPTSENNKTITIECFRDPGLQVKPKRAEDDKFLNHGRKQTLQPYGNS